MIIEDAEESCLNSEATDEEKQRIRAKPEGKAFKWGDPTLMPFEVALINV